MGGRVTGMDILAIDPGTKQSGIVLLRSCGKVEGAVWENGPLLRYLKGVLSPPFPQADPAFTMLVVEEFRSYGQKIGASCIDTIFMAGRFAEGWPGDFDLMPRKDVLKTLCGTTRAKDKDVRAECLARYGGQDVAIGKKACAGPLFGITSHAWQALGLALAYKETRL